MEIDNGIKTAPGLEKLLNSIYQNHHDIYTDRFWKPKKGQDC